MSWSLRPLQTIAAVFIVAVFGGCSAGRPPEASDASQLSSAPSIAVHTAGEAKESAIYLDARKFAYQISRVSEWRATPTLRGEIAPPGSLFYEARWRIKSQQADRPASLPQLHGYLEWTPDVWFAAGAQNPNRPGAGCGRAVLLQGGCYVAVLMAPDTGSLGYRGPQIPAGGALEGTFVLATYIPSSLSLDTAALSVTPNDEASATYLGPTI